MLSCAVNYRTHPAIELLYHYYAAFSRQRNRFFTTRRITQMRFQRNAVAAAVKPEAASASMLPDAHAAFSGAFC